MKMRKYAGLAALAAAALGPAAAQAQWGPQSGSGWRGDGWNRPGWERSRIESSRMPRSSPDAREGRVEVNRFVSADPAAAALGHGPVSIESESGEGPLVAAGARRTYEAAIIDALVGAGYDTLHPDSPQPQIVRLRVSRQMLAPAEERRSPVSGTAAMEVGTYGQSYGLGLNVDLTKPRAALVSTRLDARIVDRESGKVLWEGYATMATREGDDKWPDGMIATKLAGALFADFPKADTIAATGVGRED